MAVSSTLGVGGWSEAGWLPNFEKLVLACMDSYDSESRRFFHHFSRSTRFNKIWIDLDSSAPLQIQKLQIF